MPPGCGIIAPSPAYTRPPAIERRPPTIQAVRIQRESGIARAIDDGVKKIPPPSERPRTRNVVSQRFRPRLSSSPEEADGAETELTRRLASGEFFGPSRRKPARARLRARSARHV